MPVDLNKAAALNDMEQITVIKEIPIKDRNTVHISDRYYLIQAVRVSSPIIAGYIKFHIGKWDYGGLPLYWLGQWFDMGPNYLLVQPGVELKIEADYTPFTLALSVAEFRPLQKGV